MDESKTKKQVVAELSELRQRIAELEAAEAQWKRAEEGQRQALAEALQATHALRENEERYRNVYNTAPLAFVLWDRDRRVTNWNQHAEKLFGWSREEVLGRNIFEFLIPEAARPQVETVVAALLRGELPSRSVNENVTKDGRILLCEWNNSIRYDGKGQVVGVTSLALDITERVLAEETLQQQAQALAALNTLGRQVSASLSLDRVVQAALDGIASTTRPDLALLFLRESDKLILVGTNSSEPRHAHQETPAHRAGECLCGLAVSQGQPLYSRDIHRDPRCTWEECKKAGLRSFAALPLRSGDEIIGVLGLASGAQRNFEEQAAFLETLTNEVAMGVQNARLYDEAQRRWRELSTLYETSQALAQSLSPEVIGQKLIQTIERLLGYEYGAVLVVDEAAQEVVPLALSDRGRGSEFVAQDREFVRGQQLRVGDGIVGWVIQHGQALRLGDARQDARYFALREDVRSELCVPLVVGEKVIGALNVETSKPDAYDQDDERLLTALAGPAAVAIENARLYKETQQLAAFNESIIQSVAEGIVVEDADGVFTLVNPAAATLLGYAPDELVGLHWTAIIPPDQMPIVQAVDERRMRGEADRYELELVHKDGRRITVLTAGTPRFDEDGQFAGTMAVFTDLTEHKRAEEALRESERFLNAVVESIQDGISVLDPDLTIRHVNDVMREWYAENLPLEGKHCFACYHNVGEPCDPCPTLRCIQTGKVEMDIVPGLAGSPVEWIELFSYPMKDPHSGEVNGVVEFVRDITERKQAEQALQQRASHLALLNEIGGQVAALLDVDQVLQQAAQLVQERFGFHHVGLFTLVAGEDRLVMKARAGEFASLFPPDHSIALGQGMVGWVGLHGETLLANEVGAEPRHVNFYPDRLPTRSELSVPIRIGAAEGRIVGVLDLQSPQLNAFDPDDVTTLETLAGQIAVAIHNAHLYSQAAQRNRELALLNRVIAATAAASQEIEPILEVVCRELALAFEVPQAAAALFNEEQTEAVVVAEYLAPGRPPSLGECIPVAGNPASQHLLTHRTPLAIEDAQTDPRQAPIHNLMRQRGTVSLLLLPLMVDGEVVGTLGLDAIEPRPFSAEEVNLGLRVAEQVSGVLARARLQEERRQLQEQFHQAQKLEAVGQLAGGIAHDFNNLLTVIHLSTQLLKRNLHPDNPLRQHIERIQDAVRRTSGLTKQLLAFSRREIVEPQVLNLNQLLGELNEMLRRLIGEDVELTLLPARELWPVKIDPTQVEQVVVNLAVNARDAMPTGGKLSIETANVVLDEAYAARHLDAEPGEYVLLAVSDSGVGMSEEVQARIFEPFFTTKERGKGTGLGLATVFGIVKQNQGTIGVYSEPGQGTTFKIYLPRVPEGAAKPAQPFPKPVAARGSETVLLVEDEIQVRELTRRILQGQGYQVLTAGDGLEALQVAEAHQGPIHLLLTDVVMPRLSGKALADQLLLTRPEMRVLYTSGYTDNSIVHHGVLAEGVHFLSKPFEMDALARKVRDVLDGNV